MDGVEDLEFGAGGAWAMRAELGNSGIYLGQVLVCRDEEPLAAEATAYFGGFPEDRRPVQLAVHRDDGPVERFGRVMSGGLESGLDDGGDIPRPPAPAATRTCRVCGCWEYGACCDEDRGPCRWVYVDLCSHCAEA